MNDDAYIGRFPPVSKRADACSVIVERHTADYIDGYLVDVTTARAMLAVYRALSVTARARFDDLPLPRLVDFVWKHVA